MIPYVAVGDSVIRTSLDGTTWSSGGTVTGVLRAVAYSPTLKRWVALGNSGAFYQSTDGLTWTAGSTVGSSSVDWLGVCWSTSAGKFVAVGVSGNVATSTNGTSWTTTTSYSDTWTSVCWSATLGKFYAAGTGYVYYSSDAASWTRVAVSSGSNYIAWSSDLGTLVSVRDYGGRYSTDGTTWTSFSYSPLTGVKAVTWSPTLGLFVTVGTGGVKIASPDGITWTNRSTGSEDLYGITEKAGPLVAVGTFGTIRTSTDGTSWTTRTSGTSATLYAVA